MFEKARVAFSNKEVFGVKFTPAIDPCFLIVAKMLYSDKINIDGTIDVTKSLSFSLQELWSYVYYLYYYNRTTVSIFKSMTNPKNGKAKATLFYSAVTTLISNVGNSREDAPAKPFDVTTLIVFINNIIEEFGKELINPIFDYLNVILKKNIMTKLSTLSIITGNNGTNANKIKIVTDPAEVENANVKISLSLDQNVNK